MRTGTLLAALGAFKVAVGLAVYSDEVRRIVAGGGLATVSDQSVGAALLWFLFGGGGMFALLGLVVREGEVRGHGVPRVLGPGLAVLALFAVFLMPENGAWLILPIAALAHVRARRSVPDRNPELVP